MAVIGLDIGTTGCKCGVYSEAGKLLSVKSTEYPFSYSKEAQPIDVKALWKSVKGVLAAAAQGHEVSAVCVSSLGESFVPVGKNFEILDDAMLYTDPRGREQAKQIERALPAEELFIALGTTANGMYSLPRMMYLKENKPEVYEKAEKLLLIGDFAGYMLCGEAAIGYSLAARTMAFDITAKTWSGKLLSLGGIDKDKLSAPVKAGTVVGRVRAAVADELGLPKNCVVVAGGHDQVCAALGAGVVTAGSSIDGTGTVECITPLFDTPCRDFRLAECGCACVPYVLDGKYVTYMFSYCGGALLKWFRDGIKPEQHAELSKSGRNFYEFYNQSMPKTPTELLILPHFAGAGTPHMDNAAKGAILNLTLATTAGEIYRALMEGTAYEMRLNMLAVKACGIDITELTVTGGGAASKEWLQIKADIMGVPIYPLESGEAGIAGAAILALASQNPQADIADVAKSVVKRRAPIYPDKKNAAHYAAQFDKYKKIYNLIKELR